MVPSTASFMHGTKVGVFVAVDDLDHVEHERGVFVAVGDILT